MNLFSMILFVLFSISMSESVQNIASRSVRSSDSVLCSTLSLAEMRWHALT